MIGHNDTSGGGNEVYRINFFFFSLRRVVDVFYSFFSVRTSLVQTDRTSGNMYISTLTADCFHVRIDPGSQPSRR